MENVLLCTILSNSQAIAPKEAGTFVYSGKGLRLSALQLSGVVAFIYDPSTCKAKAGR